MLKEGGKEVRSEHSNGPGGNGDWWWHAKIGLRLATGSSLSMKETKAKCSMKKSERKGRGGPSTEQEWGRFYAWDLLGKNVSSRDLGHRLC